MGTATANLSGSGSQQVWINTYRTGQNQAGNYSSFYGELRYYGNGYGSWTTAAGYWSVSGLGVGASGSWSIPYANRNDTYTVLWAGYWNVGHDSNGNLGAFNISGSIDYSAHSSIGSGTATTSEPAPPRIPKRPSAPGTPTFSNIQADRVTVSWTPSGDNGGSTIDAYLVRRNTVSPSDSAGYVDDQQGNAGPRTYVGLKPGQRYYFSVYAHNGSADGYSVKSGDAYVDLPAGVKVSDGTKWVATGLSVSNGTSWASFMPKVSDGTTWQDPTL